MCNKEITGILLAVALSVSTGCTSLKSVVTAAQTESQYVDVFTEDKTYIRLQEVKRKKGEERAFFDHPKYLRKEVLSTAFSSIYFQEKGLSGWGKEKNVFMESELLKLTSHIADAFTRAAPAQYVLVNSSYKKGKSLFKSEVYTIFSLFILQDKLNVVFSRIQYEDLEDRGKDNMFGEAEKSVFVDPFSITKNPFWKINLREGQEFKGGHENWLIIDIKEGAFVKKEDYGKETTLSVKNEKAFSSGTEKIVTKIIQPRMSIKDQLLELKELETTGLITKEDYELRKALILGEKQEKSIKEKFNELRKLKEGGFITDLEYDQKKIDILEENYVDEKDKNIKEILAEYLELRDEGYITDNDYDYKKKKLLKDF